MALYAIAIAVAIAPCVSHPAPAETPSAKKHVSICCVGDSITEGGASFRSYRVPLESELAAAGYEVEWKGSHATPASGSSRAHEGWSGKSAEQVAAIYARNADADVADVLLLHAGHNHDAEREPPERIVSAVVGAHRRIIAAARERNPKVKVLYAQVIESGKLPKYSYIPALNEAIARTAAELSRPSSPVVCVDMATGWNWAEDTVADKVHPNAKGAEKMATKWLAALR
ncbi:MAG: hypothetical protein ILO34_03415 [Kiritimatiellae bacterium]|nr:hypothetical protein [Kiritimatiellia bacterium]